MNSAFSGFGPSTGAVATLADVKAYNVGGGTFTSAGWRTRDLAEISDPNNIVSVSSNRFVPIKGIYVVEWSAPAYDVTRHQSRLYNYTQSLVPVGGMGSTEFTRNSSVTTPSKGCCILSANGTDAFEIQHYCTVTGTTYGFGVDVEFATGTGVYTMVKLTKITHVAAPPSLLDATPVVNQVLQMVPADGGTSDISSSSTTWVDGGAEVAITPKYATSNLIVDFRIFPCVDSYANNGMQGGVRILKDGSAVKTTTVHYSQYDTRYAGEIFSLKEVAGSVAARTYKLQINRSTGGGAHIMKNSQWRPVITATEIYAT